MVEVNNTAYIMLEILLDIIQDELNINDCVTDRQSALSQDKLWKPNYFWSSIDTHKQ